jgi:hypothetical protein
MSKAVLNIVLNADHKLMSTESLSHLAAALNISVPGVRNLRFKLRAALKIHSANIASTSPGISSSASVADFFNLFESHRKPVLLSIAALHRIQVSDKPSIDSLRRQITQHILSGDCTQFSQQHPPISLPNGLSFPNCADVCNEWQVNNIDPDIQVHILSAVYGSKISSSPLRRVLSNLDVQYDNDDSLPQLRRKLKSYILKLRKGKDTDRIQRQKHDKLVEEREQLESVRRSWPQLVPQSLKNKILRLFRNETSSDALSTFTCAACAESVPLRSHCSVTVGDPNIDLDVLKRPDLRPDDSLLLDQYKWLNPECDPPPMPFDEGPLRDILVDRDGVYFPSDHGPPSLSLCKSCHSALKKKKVACIGSGEQNISWPCSKRTQESNHNRRSHDCTVSVKVLDYQT